MLGDIAGLIAACAFVLLVGAIAIPLIKLGGVMDEVSAAIQGMSAETQTAVRDVVGEAVPLMGEVRTSVATANTQLVRVDAITANVQAATGNISGLTSVLAATLGTPVIKVAALAYAVRSTLADTAPRRSKRRVDAAERTAAMSEHAADVAADVAQRHRRRAR